MLPDRRVHRRAEGPAPAGPHVPRRHQPRPHRRATTRSRRRWPPSSPTASGSTPASCTSTTCRTRDFLTPAARVGGEAPAGVRLHHRGAQDPPRPDGPHRRRADRLDGHRHPRGRAVRPVPAAVRLLPAAVRPGHQPAARRHPRGAGHLDGQGHRPRGEPAAPRARRRAARSCCPSRSSPTRSWPSSSTSTTTTTCPASSRSPSTASTRWPRAARACAGRSRRCGPRSARPWPTGAKLIVLSDRHSSAELAPIPSLLLTSAVHHHLIREKTRTQVGLVVECGDAREVHHMALLLGFGAAAINPYLAFETIEDLIDQGVITGITKHKAVRNFVKACTKGVLKIMSKMGISTVASYTGAQVFEAIGLGPGPRRRVLHRHHQPHRRRRPRRARRGGGRPPPLRLPRPARGGRPPRPLGRRRVPVATRGRAPPLQPGDGVQAPARHPHEALRRVQGVHGPGRRPGQAPGHPARPVRAPRGRRLTDADRRGGAGSAPSSSGSPPAP